MSNLAAPPAQEQRASYQLNVAAVSDHRGWITVGVQDPGEPTARGGYLQLTRAALEALPAALAELLQRREGA